jgi:fumarylacetoacetate (FAA) hydrolase
VAWPRCGVRGRPRGRVTEVRVRLCTFRTADGPPEGWPGRVDGDRILQLDAPDLAAVLAHRGEVPSGAAFRAAHVELLTPVPRPPSVRDFFAFEQHIATARANRGASVPAEWYEFPVFYFSNPTAIFGPDAEIPYPAGTAMLDYELEVAAIIGADGEIGGFTIMNDWSARDIQRQEMRVGLGPAKGKDFATSLGPVVVTPDEFDCSQAVMTARVNGEERSRGNLADIYYSWPAILAQAARNTVLRPGEIIGSGTVGTGCILEHDDGRWLVPGDTVELEVAGIGLLRNRIGPPRARTPSSDGA